MVAFCVGRTPRHSARGHCCSGHDLMIDALEARADRAEISQRFLSQVRLSLSQLRADLLESPCRSQALRRGDAMFGYQLQSDWRWVAMSLCWLVMPRVKLSLTSPCSF